MKKTLLSILACAATLVACQKNEAPVAPGVPDVNNPVRFSVTNLGTYQFKSPTYALGTDGCSTVGIYAADLVANHVESTVSGSTLTPATPIYWGIGQTASTSFCARYPYANANASGDYDIPADQRAEDTFTYHDNVLTAVTVASPSTEGGVVFNFKHPFAKVVINVENNLGGDGVASVKLTGMKCKASTFNVAVMPPVTALSDEDQDTRDMMAYNYSAGVYQLIVMPQTAQPNIVVTTQQGSVYTFALTASYDFEAGKIATASVTLDPIGGSTGGGSQQAAAFSYSNVVWADAASQPSNSESSSTLGNYWHVIGCVYDNAHKNITATPAWSFDYPMALGNDDKWSVTINYDEDMSDSGKGFKFRRFTSGTSGDARWTTQYGFHTETPDNLTLESGTFYQNLLGTGSSKNIRLASKGQWTLVLDGANLTVTRIGDVTEAIVTE